MMKKMTKTLEIVSALSKLNEHEQPENWPEHGEWTPTQATDMGGNEMERFEILARIDEVRWLCVLSGAG
jgi:hypothetical protein